jgi:hypothetical protein
MGFVHLLKGGSESLELANLLYFVSSTPDSDSEELERVARNN